MHIIMSHLQHTHPYAAPCGYLVSSLLITYSLLPMPLCRCRQRYSGPSGYLSEEVEVVMRVGSGIAGKGCMRLRFTSLWLSRALRPQEDGDKVRETLFFRNQTGWRGMQKGWVVEAQRHTAKMTRPCLFGSIWQREA